MIYLLIYLFVATQARLRYAINNRVTNSNGNAADNLWSLFWPAAIFGQLAFFYIEWKTPGELTDD